MAEPAALSSTAPLSNSAGGGFDPCGALQTRLGCDRTGVIARLTGRVSLPAAELAVLSELGVTRLALG